MKARLAALAATAALVAAQPAPQQGNNLQLFPCSQNASAVQSFKYQADTTILLTKSNNLCIDIDNYGTSDGSIFWTYACHQSDKDPGHQNQEFTLGPNKQVVSTLSGKCMTAIGNYEGAMIELQTCTGSAAQQWTWNADGTVTNGQPGGMCLDAGSFLPPVCERAPNSGLPFCNVTLTIEERVADLVGRLQPTTKYNMFNTASGGAPEIGLGAYQWWSEALHGVAGSPGVTFGNQLPGATSFPQVCTTAMSWNTTLFHTIGSTIGTEARAFSNQNQAGLTFWTPNVNIFRDPRWGRGQETPGEDPVLNAVYARTFVPGLQEGDDPRYIKASACCKHYAGYSLEQWNGTDRHHFNAIINDQDLSDTYFPAFQSCAADARVSGMMCSYNEVNGVPSCASFFLNTQVFREEWGFNGYITSDCGAVSDVISTHHYTNNSDETVHAVLTSGMDIGCDGYLPPALPGAVADGAIQQSDIDAALTNLFRVRFRLGQFDPKSNQPYTTIPPSAVCTNASIALALKAAEQGMTLLKNAAVKGLPLAASATHTLAVVGPNAAATTTMQGNYYGAPCFAIPSVVDALQGFAAVNYVQGCNGVPCTNTTGFPAAAAAAASADATILVVGNDQGQESEGHDRTIIALPGAQADLIASTCAAAALASKPCIVVVLSGSSLDLSDSQANANVTGIIFAGYPGQSGAQAIANTIFGLSVPAGRLVQTFYPSSFTDMVSLFEMNMRPGPSVWPPGNSPGRTYRFYTGPVVYPFGYGLSYTTFSYAVSGPSSVPAVATEHFLATASSKRFGSKFTPLESPTVVQYTVNVTNTGSIDADDVVLGFLQAPGAGTNGIPLQELFGFQRVFVPAGQTVTVWLGVQARHLTRVLEDGSRVPLPGTWTLHVGPQTHAMAVKPAEGEATPAYASMSFTVA